MVPIVEPDTTPPDVIEPVPVPAANDHVPLPVASAKAVVLLIQTVDAPVIEAGLGLMVTNTEVELALPKPEQVITRLK